MVWDLISRYRNKSAAAPLASTGPATVSSQVSDNNKTMNEHLFIARAPVFSDTEQITGYLLTTPAQDHTLDVAPADAHTSVRLIMDVLDNFGLDQLIGDKMAFIPISLGAVSADAIGILPPQKVVLELHPGAVPESDLADICAAVHEKGFRYALNEYELNEHTQEAFLKASFAASDISRGGAAEAVQHAFSLRHLPLQRIAWNIRSRSDFDACRSSGAFNLYQGNVFEQSQSWSMNRVDPANLRVVEVFNLVMNQVDLDAIEEAFKHDVGLSYSLLTYLNSAGIGLSYKTHSIRHAIMQLGYDYLARWLSLLIFAGVDTRAAQRVLLNTALIRARLAELLGKAAFSKKEADQLFIVGMFSLLDALFGIPLEEALGKLNLSKDIVDALLHESGRFRPYLELAMSFEGKDLKRAEDLCSRLGLDLASASHAHLSAIEWARKMS